MKKPILNLPGAELFEIYTAERNEYSQTLLTAYSLIGDDLFPLLEQAEKEQKKIALDAYRDDMDDPIVDVVIQ